MHLVMVGDGMKEWIRVSQDSVVSYGIEGINLFKNGILYTGYYSNPRLQVEMLNPCLGRID